MTLADFWTNVDRSAGPDGCWPWTGPVRNATGYGCFRVDGKPRVAHRWLLGELRGAPLAWPTEEGCHTCDNPPCCNPAHLYIGDHSSNALDAIERSGHPAAARRAQTHCLRGHEFTPDNTHQFGPGARRRYCRTCKRDQSRDGQRRRREHGGVHV